MILEMDIEIRGKHGLHVRPCASLVKICASDPNVSVKIKNMSDNGLYVDGKSMMQVSSLRAASGQKLHFVFEGENPKIVAEKVDEFLSRLD